jgi:hypothetical protein
MCNDPSTLPSNETIAQPRNRLTLPILNITLSQSFISFPLIRVRSSGDQKSTDNSRRQRHTEPVRHLRKNAGCSVTGRAAALSGNTTRIRRTDSTICNTTLGYKKSVCLEKVVVGSSAKFVTTCIDSDAFLSGFISCINTVS